jgi:hypothetical protein
MTTTTQIFNALGALPIGFVPYSVPQKRKNPIHEL